MGLTGTQYYGMAQRASYRLPREWEAWREDCAQECYCALLQARPDNAGLEKVIALRREKDFWRWLTSRGMVSLDAGREGQSLAELIVDESADSSITAVETKEAILGVLAEIPQAIIALGQKRVAGHGLTPAEQKALERWRKASPALALATKEALA